MTAAANVPGPDIAVPDGIDPATVDRAPNGEITACASTDGRWVFYRTLDRQWVAVRTTDDARHPYEPTLAAAVAAATSGAVDRELADLARMTPLGRTRKEV